MRHNMQCSMCKIRPLKLRRNNFQKKFLKRFVSLRSAFITSSHLNLISLCHIAEILCHSFHAGTKRHCSLIMLALFSGKRNVSVWRPSVCPVCFLTLIGHAARRIVNVTHQGAAHDAANANYCPNIRKTDILLKYSLKNYQ